MRTIERFIYIYTHTFIKNPFLNYNLKTHHPVILSRLPGIDFDPLKNNAGVSKDAAHCTPHTLQKNFSIPLREKSTNFAGYEYASGLHLKM